jgi:hypothetical protein
MHLATDISSEGMRKVQLQHFGSHAQAASENPLFLRTTTPSHRPTEDWKADWEYGDILVREYGPGRACEETLGVDAADQPKQAVVVQAYEIGRA